MPQVFLSYKREDRAVAERLVAALREDGFEIWWDREIAADAPWEESIETALRRATAVVVLWSPAAVASENVKAEARWARQQGRLLQAFVRPCEPPLFFGERQGVDLSRWKGNRDSPDYQALVTRLGAMVAGDPQSTQHDGVARRQRLRSRRAVIAGGLGAAMVAATAGFGAWILRAPASRAPPPQAAGLMAEASVRLGQADVRGYTQALALFRRVVEVAPDYADGWGALAYAYMIGAHALEAERAAEMNNRARAAAERALSLDTENGYAQAAIAGLAPLIGSWATREASLRAALAQHPENEWLLTGSYGLAITLMSVGRNRDAVELMGRAAERPNPAPGVLHMHATALVAAGRIDEADRVSAAVLALDPTHIVAWSIRFTVLAHSGRAREALRMVENEEARPLGVSDDDFFENLGAIARALENRREGDVARAMRLGQEALTNSAVYAEFFIPAASALDRLDDALALAAAYYFGEGFSVAARRGATETGLIIRREDARTYMLFIPATAPLRADPRFAALTRRLGLTRYWAETGQRPDYLQQR